MVKNLQRGSALISSLFIMTLVSIAVTAMLLIVQLDLQRIRLTILNDKLYFASQAVTFWALSKLADEKAVFSRHDDFGKILDYPPKLERIYPDVVISGKLYDLQARFNLNNLVDQNYQLPFLNLLALIKPKLSAEEKENLRIAIRNWISSYQVGSGQETLSNYYLKQKPPYFTAQQFFQHQSEFRLVKGVNAEVYTNLFYYITSLPEITAININTAPKAILSILGNGLNNTQIEEILMSRGKIGIQDSQSLTVLLKKLNIKKNTVTIESNYFLCVAYVKHADLKLISYTVFKRNRQKDGKPTVHIVSESLNS